MEDNQLKFREKAVKFTRMNKVGTQKMNIIVIAQKEIQLNYSKFKGYCIVNKTG